ncbi:hypothetical protein D050_4791 [Vibrio parahaemolyticus VPCR-2009]|nr:hypothetical protein D050_4791 [Vibrio parahaemolyticus VPCR-2009]
MRLVHYVSDLSVVVKTLGLDYSFCRQINNFVTIFSNLI